MNLPIIDAVEAALIEAELTPGRFLRNTNKGHNSLYIVDAHSCPNTMREIGRLREIAFRGAGGGTGKDCDIDEFDTMPAPCHQLIVWDPENKLILGGYRFIRGAEMEFDNEGKPRIATAHMFSFSRKFLEEFLPATIELGRSFVRTEYQSSREGIKSIYVLDNLWDGLGALTVLYPEIKYLFGKVTMYPSYNEECRNMILHFLHKHFPDRDGLVRPIEPLQVPEADRAMEEMFHADDFKADYRILNAAVQSHGYHIPPLVNAYMSLSPTMRMFGTAVNSSFGNVEESGIFLAIDEILQEKKRPTHKYISSMSDKTILSELTAISPVDGRYRRKSQPLARFFSEYAVMRYRVLVEVEYFIALAGIGLPQLPALSVEDAGRLRGIYRNFSEADAVEIKDIEKVTNHDVKAVEYFLKRHFKEFGLEKYSEFIHFGLTSQDINNTAFHMALAEALAEVAVPAYRRLHSAVAELADSCRKYPMLARTHGQPASPTTMGKELEVFAYRLSCQLEVLAKTPVTGKFGGATGNFNAHRAAYPGIDWIDFGNKFLSETLGIGREQSTTQISNYDNLAAVFDALARINTIIIDLDRDIWQYISMGYFHQRIVAGEVGSSAMPHKVNPIDFENSEGNMGIANAILAHLSAKLPVSRLQRDLTDSTVIRNIGVPLAHSLIAVESTLKGLGKLIVDPATIAADLDGCWSVLAEAIQTILRREGYPQPYEALKQLTRTNEAIDSNSIREFIDSLQGISEDVRAELHSLTPSGYVGYAAGI